MIGPFIHRIDPVAGEVGGVCLWWYGIGYALGFLETHLWLRRARQRIGLTLEEVYELSLMLGLGILAGGRVVEVLFYEWPFYSQRPWLIPALWLGGMATHGLLLGAAGAAWVFCRLHRKPLFALLDELVIPGAFLMGLGRIGNFIDGQIVGSATDMLWAVKFPDVDGFRHPVVLYDGLKNLLLVPLLLWIRNRCAQTGVVTAHFFFWYGFLRIFVDLFREYPTTLLGLATGQSLNILMAVLGAGLLLSRLQKRAAPATANSGSIDPPRQGMLWPKRIALVGLLLFCTTIPSDSTQDIPARYGKRHPGLHYSAWYPQIQTEAR